MSEADPRSPEPASGGGVDLERGQPARQREEPDGSGGVGAGGRRQHGQLVASVPALTTQRAEGETRRRTWRPSRAPSWTRTSTLVASRSKRRRRGAEKSPLRSRSLSATTSST